MLVSARCDGGWAVICAAPKPMNAYGRATVGISAPCLAYSGVSACRAPQRPTMNSLCTSDRYAKAVSRG